MRVSDGIDLGLDLAPRKWATLFFVCIVGWVTATGNWAPVEWYIRDKATGIVEQVQPALERISAELRRQTYIRHELHKPYPASHLSTSAR